MEKKLSVRVVALARTVEQTEKYFNCNKMEKLTQNNVEEIIIDKNVPDRLRIVQLEVPLI